MDRGDAIVPADHVEQERFAARADDGLDVQTLAVDTEEGMFDGLRFRDGGQIDKASELSSRNGDFTIIIPIKRFDRIFKNLPGVPVMGLHMDARDECIARKVPRQSHHGEGCGADTDPKRFCMIHAIVPACLQSCAPYPKSFSIVRSHDGALSITGRFF